MRWEALMTKRKEQAEEITFESGYEELKDIVDRLDQDNVSVHEMCELFARGKGLEQGLREYLATQQGKLEEIEQGENLPEFRIVAPSVPAESTDGDDDTELDSEGGPSEPATTASSSSEDNLPF